MLIVVTDDQRADTMETLGATRRRWADEGRRMINGFVTTPLCCPARTSIMTGRYVHNHGVLNNRMTEKIDHEQTLQYYLSQARIHDCNFWEISQ